MSQFVCYTPYGEAIVDEHLTTYENPFKFSGKELDDITGLYDHGARSRNPISTLWYGVDPLFEKYPDFSPYNYCAGNPVKLVDPDGCDTVDIKYNIDSKHWDIGNISKVEGDDVFRVTGKDGKTSNYTFSEGEYGKRMSMLNLEEECGAMIGVYHVSGQGSDLTGYYVAPNGQASSEKGSNARVPDGTYPLIAPNGGEGWQQLKIGGIVDSRGCRIHNGPLTNDKKANFDARSYTTGCFIVSSSYSKEYFNGKLKIAFNKCESTKALKNIDSFYGATSFGKRWRKTNTGGYNRLTSNFPPNLKGQEVGKMQLQTYK